ncbi:nitroreductase [Companilactobacillus keshanensis]|uniref:Nitroreductase n=1 Tax=Companilactobacillus keshanensis TaxID=2486003 RepID=A0ABW4BSQ0_9LACO|nr:nitroreductase [Companilactobacillus keshanensis]
MENSNLIYQRKSIRSFSDRRISTITIEEIIQDAQRAPSWQNSQPWEVYIASGENVKKIRSGFKITNEAGKTDLTTPHRTSRSELSMNNIKEWSKSVEEAVGVEGTDDPEWVDARNNLFYAPYLVYLTTSKKASEFTIYDMGAFGQTLMLSAASHGIGTIPAYALSNHPEIIKKELSIPQDQEIVVGIAMGYANNSKINNISTKRASVKKILHMKE